MEPITSSAELLRHFKGSSYWPTQAEENASDEEEALKDEKRKVARQPSYFASLAIHLADMTNERIDLSHRQLHEVLASLWMLSGEVIDGTVETQSTRQSTLFTLATYINSCHS